MTRNRPAFRPIHKVDEDKVKADEPVRSNSDSPSMSRLLAARGSRRVTLRGERRAAIGPGFGRAFLSPPVARQSWNKAVACGRYWGMNHARQLRGSIARSVSADA